MYIFVECKLLEPFCPNNIKFWVESNIIQMCIALQVVVIISYLFHSAPARMIHTQHSAAWQSAATDIVLNLQLNSAAPNIPYLAFWLFTGKNGKYIINEQ